MSKSKNVRSKSKKSNRSKFLSHLMRAVSGDLGDSLSEAFAAGNFEKIKLLMTRVTEKLAASPKKATSTSAAQILRDAGVPFLMHGSNVSVASDVSVPEIKDLFSRFNMHVDVDEDGNIIMQGRQRVSKSADDFRERD